MRRLISILIGALLLTGTYPGFADSAVLVDEAVMVLRDPRNATGNSSSVASYLTSGGFAITSAEYVDAAGMSFDFGSTTSVSQATLRLPVDDTFSLGGSVPIRVFAFADNGVIEYTDYAVGLPAPVAELEIAGVAEVVIDVTGITNAILSSSRYAGFRVSSAVAPGDIPEGSFPAYKGVKFNPQGYALEFTPGSPVVPGRNTATYDGFKLATPNINVPGMGVVYAELQLTDVNSGIYTLVDADIVPGGGGSGRSGVELLDCDAFAPPAATQGVANGTSSFSESSGLLDIPQTSFNGVPYSAILKIVEGSEPIQFRLVSLQQHDALSNLSSASSLGGGFSIEPTQDFVPLCHGWVLIGDSLRNRLVERNVITGETGRSYAFNTQPNQLTLDDVNNIVYFSTHPETERLYKLDLNSGVISYNRIIEGFRQFAPRDMVMGENGNLFVVLYDRDQLDPPDPDDPVAAEGLWLGLLNSNATPVVPNIPLASPIRIDYDPVFQRVFLTTESNLATFDFNPGSNGLTFVTGTDVPVGSGCTDFDISPLGNRLAYACPNGNNETVTPLAIHDLDPVDYYNPDGEWYMGNTPVSATFSEEGDLLISTDGSELYFFDVVTHLLLRKFDLGIIGDEVVKQIRLSRDGDILLVFIENALNDDNGRMYWMPMPDISGTPVF